MASMASQGSLQRPAAAGEPHPTFLDEDHGHDHFWEEDASPQPPQTHQQHPRGTFSSTAKTVPSGQQQQRLTLAPTLALDVLGHKGPTADDYERLARIFVSEIDSQPMPDFLKTVQSNMSQAARLQITEWMGLSAEQLGYHHGDTLPTAIAIFDRILARLPLVPQVLQLVAAGSLLVAAKLYEVEPPSITPIRLACGNVYTHDDIRQVELIILSQLGWRTRALTVHDTMYLLCWCFPVPASVANVSDFLVESCYFEYPFARRHPAQVSVAAVSAAFRHTGQPEALRTQWMQALKRVQCQVHEEVIAPLECHFLALFKSRFLAIFRSTAPTPAPAPASAPGQPHTQRGSASDIDSIDRSGSGSGGGGVGVGVAKHEEKTGQTGPPARRSLSLSSSSATVPSPTVLAAGVYLAESEPMDMDTQHPAAAAAAAAPAPVEPPAAISAAAAAAATSMSDDDGQSTTGTTPMNTQMQVDTGASASASASASVAAGTAASASSGERENHLKRSCGGLRVIRKRRKLNLDSDAMDIHSMEIGLTGTATTTTSTTTAASTTLI